MRLGMTAKIFLALLAIGLIVTVVMGVATRMSFQQGFRDYLLEQERQRLEALSAVLVDVFQEHGDWRFLRDNPRQWRYLQRLASRQLYQDGHGSTHSRRERSPLSAAARLSLLDHEKELVIGQLQVDRQATLYPIVADEQTVGWLAMTPLQSPISPTDMHFQQQQLKAGLLTGVLALLLAAATSLLLTWRLLLPVRELAGATHALAAGDYASRVDVSSGDALGRLAQDFNHLADTLERNEQLRRVFMADVSHELRTPLAVLRGELEALQDGVRQLTPASLQSLQAEVAALSKLVDDLYELALSDVGALTYQKTSIDLVELTQACLNGFRGRFEERGLALEQHLPAEPLLLLADRARLMQLLNNLLENSLRYTDAGGLLRVSLARQGTEVVMVLEDSAPAVEEALLPQLFERFYRPELSRSRAHGGAGLGLPLCRNIVAAHAGRIEAQASALGGLRIVVRLPLG